MSEASGVELPPSLVASVLEMIRLHTGVDFSGYRQPMVQRRIRNHMLALGGMSADAYLAQLHETPALAHGALERLTIKVSRFYRDAPVFDRLYHNLLPSLSQAAPSRALRIWSAGCGTGEEAYTFALMLRALHRDGEVVATDIDRSALAVAQRGVYAEAAIDDLPPALRAGLERASASPYCEVTAAVRARVRWQWHDLTGAARLPDAAFDVVSCRNVLIYLQRAQQEHVLGQLLRALRPGGVLVLGEAEWPLPSALGQLQVIGAQQRLFRRAGALEVAA
jgi:chemotaxis protein methyltransferase CheR/two-component system CheB/CheR fusion protein